MSVNSEKHNPIFDACGEKFNTGSQNIGNFNSGNYNTGFQNIGDSNSGQGNYGYANVGSFNIGSFNTGDFNATHFSTGCFNTEGYENIKMFNKLSPWTYSNWVSSDAYKILTTIPQALEWVQRHNMTFHEKILNPEHSIIKGYVKAFDYPSLLQKRQSWWDNLSETAQNTILSLPNFDAEIFNEVTGIVIHERKKWKIHIKSKRKNSAKDFQSYTTGGNEIKEIADKVGYAHFNKGSYNLNTNVFNIGDFNTGKCNIGDDNTGNFNVGSHNAGDFNCTDYSTGCFNTIESLTTTHGNPNIAFPYAVTTYLNSMFDPNRIRMFNMTSPWTYGDWLGSQAAQVLYQIPKQAVWVNYEDMTEAEKKSHPNCKAAFGYTKQLETEELNSLRQNWWDKLSRSDQEAILNLPNFRHDIFEKITGIAT